MAKDFQPTEPTVRIIFAPEHIGQDGVIQLAAFYDFRRELVGNQSDNRRNNDVSLFRLIGERPIESLKANTRSIVERKNQKKLKDGKESDVSFAGICLIYSDQVILCENGVFSFYICATPNVLKWNAQRKALIGDDIKNEEKGNKKKDNENHVSLWILENKRIAQFSESLPAKGQVIRNRELFGLIQKLVNGINNQSLGKKFDEHEFQATPLDSLNQFCIEKSIPSVTS